jgi:hypothetical protein
MIVLQKTQVIPHGNHSILGAKEKLKTNMNFQIK